MPKPTNARNPLPPATDVWRDIDTAPKSKAIPTRTGMDVRGEYFLAYCPDESATDPLACMCVCWWEPCMISADGTEGMWTGEAGFELNPTDWMPLPAPPAGEVRDAARSAA